MTSDRLVYTGLTVYGVRRTFVELPAVPLLFGAIDTEADLFWVCDRRTQQATAPGQRRIGGRDVAELVEQLIAEIEDEDSRLIVE